MKPKDNYSRFKHFKAFMDSELGLEVRRIERQQTAQEIFNIIVELKNKIEKTAHTPRTPYFAGMLFSLSELQSEIKQKYLGKKE